MVPNRVKKKVFSEKKQICNSCSKSIIVETGDNFVTALKIRYSDTGPIFSMLTRYLSAKEKTVP